MPSPAGSGGARRDRGSVLRLRRAGPAPGGRRYGVLPRLPGADAAPGRLARGVGPPWDLAQRDGSRAARRDSDGRCAVLFVRRAAGRPGLRRAARVRDLRALLAQPARRTAGGRRRIRRSRDQRPLVPGRRRRRPGSARGSLGWGGGPRAAPGSGGAGLDTRQRHRVVQPLRPADARSRQLRADRGPAALRGVRGGPDARRAPARRSAAGRRGLRRLRPRARRRPGGGDRRVPAVRRVPAQRSRARHQRRLARASRRVLDGDDD